jgi:hypothetical protein
MPIVRKFAFPYECATCGKVWPDYEHSAPWAHLRAAKNAGHQLKLADPNATYEPVAPKRKRSRPRLIKPIVLGSKVARAAMGTPTQDVNWDTPNSLTFMVGGFKVNVSSNSPLTVRLDREGVDEVRPQGE